jgi:hypothetical protein
MVFFILLSLVVVARAFDASIERASDGLMRERTMFYFLVCLGAACSGDAGQKRSSGFRGADGLRTRGSRAV